MKMKLKTKVVLIVSVIALFFCTGVVYAATLSDIQITNDIYTGKITIMGKIDKSYPTNINAMITSANVNLSEFRGEDILAKGLGIGQTKSLSNGTFMIQIVLNEEIPTGTYRGFISAENTAYQSKDFSYKGRGDVKSAVKKFSDAATVTEMVYAIDHYSMFLEIDNTLYEGDGFDKSGFAALLLGAKPTGGFADLPRLNQAFLGMMAIHQLNIKTSADEVNTYLTDNAGILGINITKYAALQNSAVKKAVCTDILGHDFINSTEIQEYLDEKVVLYSCTLAQDWNDVFDLVKEYPNRFTLSTGVAAMLSQLKYPDEVYKILYVNRSSYKTVAMIADGYANAILSRYNIEKSSGGNGNGNGGGGGGGGGHSATIAMDPGLLPQLSNKVFNDTDGVAWAEEAIAALYARKIIAGDGTGKFYPEDSVTREEFIKMIIGAFEIPLEETKVDFSDVGDGAWYTSYIATAAKKGITNGNGTAFGVGSEITRQDLATLVYRAAVKQGYLLSKGELAAADKDEISGYAAEAIASLQQMGIINGMPDGSFMPRENATRAQAAKIIYGLLKALGR